MRAVELVVLGAGPGGCAAAVQAARLGVQPLIFDRAGRAGGLLENARVVENYPGLEAPISGALFAARLGEHLARFGLAVEAGTVASIAAAPGGAGFELRGSFGELRARSVIVAAGTAPRTLGVPGEEALSRSRLFYEVKHLLPRPPGRVVVIGGGEAAFDYALSLAGSGARVEMCIRSERPAAQGRLAEQVLAEPGITVATRSEVLELAAEADGVAVTIATPEGRRKVTAGAVLVAVGRQSAAAPLLGSAAPGRGLFVIGDARRGRLGQAGMAVGDGLDAAAQAIDFLKGEA